MKLVRQRYKRQLNSDPGKRTARVKIKTGNPVVFLAKPSLDLNIFLDCRGNDDIIHFLVVSEPSKQQHELRL